MNTIIVRPPPMVNAPTFRKYAQSSARLCGSGTPLTAAGAAFVSHHDTEITPPQVSKEATTTNGLRGWKRTSPAAPARTRIATIPSGVETDATAAITAMPASDTVFAADRPSRYKATANRPTTTGPRPYSAPRAIGVTPSPA